MSWSGRVILSAIYGGVVVLAVIWLLGAFQDHWAGHALVDPAPMHQVLTIVPVR